MRCNRTHRVTEVTYTGTAINLTATDTTDIASMERFNLDVHKPISELVTGAPVPVQITVNGVGNIPIKNGFGLPLMSNVVPLGVTRGRYVVDDSKETPETYVILKTPCYA